MRLIWDELEDAFPLEQSLRHPEARRIADRAALLRQVAALVRGGALRRVRRVVDPRTREYRVFGCSIPAPVPRAGTRAQALAAIVADRPRGSRANAPWPALAMR